MWKGFKNNSKYSKCTNEPCLVWTWLCPLPLPLSLLGLIYFARGPSPIRDFCNFFYCGQVSQIRSTSLSAMSSFHNLEKGFLQCDLLFFLSLNAKWMSIVRWMNIKRIRWPCPELFVCMALHGWYHHRRFYTFQHYNICHNMIRDLLLLINVVAVYLYGIPHSCQRPY